MHHDVSVVWWRKHFHCAFNGNKHMDGLDVLFEALLDNDITGPVMPKEWEVTKVPAPMAPDAVFAWKEPKESLLSCKPEDVDKALELFASSRTVRGAAAPIDEPCHLVGCSQESQFCEDHNDHNDPLFDHLSLDLEETTCNTEPQPPSRSATARQELAPKISTLLQLCESENIEEIDAPSSLPLSRAIDDLIVNIRGKLSEVNGNNRGQKWVSSNSERDTKKRRTHAARNGLTEFG